VGIPTTERIYTASLNFRKQTKYNEPATGFLNDSLILSFGLGDNSSHFVQIAVQDVLQGHHMCADLIEEYITESVG
jgi:hypothetical protein